MITISMQASIPDLSKILTPSLYQKILKVQFPWNGPVDMKFASRFYFRGVPDNSHAVYDTCHHTALKPLSKVFLATRTIPDLAVYLPEPSDPKYAEYALALILLVDQSPRSLYRHSDVRWGPMFFDVTSQRLIKRLVSAGTFPDDTEIWTRLGYSFEDIMVRKMWIYAPLIHSEHLEDQRLASGKIEQMRREVESYTGKTDPWRATKDKDGDDTMMFHRLIEQGPPGTFAEFFFWLYRIFDAHLPIIEKYGRYPYNNTSVGRVSTEEEEQYLLDTEGFHVPSLTDEEVRKLREQVERDIWEPLSDRGPW